jgi:glycosyltransferase involved in cell wall biosynthesis
VEKYLVRCLDSLVCQTLRNIEILCVNDGSTDSSGAILDEYAQKDSRITVFNQENQGPGVARNTALNNAKGKYILFCDADDTFEPEAAFECSEAMEKNNVDVVIFNANIVEVDRSAFNNKNIFGEFISPAFPKDAGKLNQRECFKISLFANVLFYCFRFDLIKRYHLRFPHYRICEDSIFFIFYLMIIQSGCFLDRKLYTYYAQMGSLGAIVQSKQPFLTRLSFLPKLLWQTLKFSVKYKKPLKEIYVFYWIFVWVRSRFMR